MYRSSESNVVLLVFRSGRIVLTGGRDIYCLNTAWRRMQPLLARYVVDTDKAETRVENASFDTSPRQKKEAKTAAKTGTWSKSAALAAQVYVAEAAHGYECDSRACGRVDGDIPAKRTRV